MRRALIYVPAGLVDDAEYANDCIAYARRRGCQGDPLILRDWIDMESAMSAGWFWLIIVARYEHRAGHRIGQHAEVAVASRDRRGFTGRHRAIEGPADLLALEEQASVTCVLSEAALPALYRSSRGAAEGADSPEVLREVEIYRAGYSDGFADCLTLRDDSPPGD